jgi:hypothetical protein
MGFSSLHRATEFRVSGPPRRPAGEDDGAIRHLEPGLTSVPLQAADQMAARTCQKQLRLREARRLILTQSIDAASAGHVVGYESPSQFS